MYERMLDRTNQPTDTDMRNTIGQPMAEAWGTLRNFIEETYRVIPTIDPGGKKYGWNLKYRTGSRPLSEMYPEHGSFTVLVILGKTELEKALGRLDTFGPLIQKALAETPRLHDGCWMYIRLADPSTCQQDIQDIQQLILIKKKPPKKEVEPKT